MRKMSANTVIRIQIQMMNRKKMTIDDLKLDKSFLTDLVGDTRALAIVQSTIMLAHSLGLRLVAEGVEDERTLQVLTDFGCDETQGYLHSRPLAPAAFRTWLADRSRESDALPA